MPQRVFPQLRMTDWKRTRAFYVDGLGFAVDWEHRFEPGFPVFAQLTLWSFKMGTGTSPEPLLSTRTTNEARSQSPFETTRDGLSLFLTEHTGDCQVGGAAYFVVDDVDALYRDIRGRDVTPDEPPEDAPWGTREMNVIDPDGNRLRFANPAKE